MMFLNDAIKQIRKLKDGLSHYLKLPKKATMKAAAYMNWIRFLKMFGKNSRNVVETDCIEYSCNRQVIIKDKKTLYVFQKG